MNKTIITLILIILAGCSAPDRKEFLSKIPAEGKSHLVIWAHSDIQPRRVSQKKYYEIAIEDVMKNVKDIDIAVVAGDIIQNTKPPGIFQWYNSLKKKTYIKHWYEIAGNHDNKDYGNFRKYINLPPHYSVKIGNILVLLMSDEDSTPPTVISDDVFRWWKDLVIKNQDKIIITVTHGYLKQSNLFGSIINSRNISNSDRFTEVLGKYRVDIWICGHTHLPHFIQGRIKVAKDLNNTFFINVSAIRGDPFMDVESNFFIFRNGSDYVLVRSRKHDSGDYISRMDIFHKLGHKFQWDGSGPVMAPWR